MHIKELSIDIGGRHLAAVDFGGRSDDRIVLAVHGWMDNAASFMELAPRLAGCRVIALDLAGHGRSDWRDESSWYAIWDYVMDLHSVVRALGVEEIHLLGHSLGAGVLSLLAAVLPEQVRSLVMLEGLGPLVIEPEDAPEQMIKGLAWNRGDRSVPVVYTDRERMVLARMRGRFPVGREAAQHLLSRSIKSVAGGYGWTHDPKLMAPSLIRLSSAQVEAFFSRIRVPVLACLTDGGIATADSRRRLSRIEGVQVINLRGGHHPHLESESIGPVAEAINAFYRRVDQKRLSREVLV